MAGFNPIIYGRFWVITEVQAVFRRLLPRRGYLSAIWAIAHRLCRLVWKILHEGIRYIEQGTDYEPKLLIHRARYLARQLRKFGYDLRVTPTNPDPTSIATASYSG